MGDYYQSSELVDRINWKRIMKMERCAGTLTYQFAEKYYMI